LQNCLQVGKYSSPQRSANASTTYRYPMNTHKEESGTAIFVVMMIVAILMVIVGAMAAYTTTINRHVQRSDTLGSAMAIGDGCVDHMFAYWRQACRNQNNKALTT